jgi:hypothetical protein
MTHTIVVDLLNIQIVDLGASSYLFSLLARRIGMSLIKALKLCTELLYSALLFLWTPDVANWPSLIELSHIVRREASRRFRKKREYVTDTINELATNSKNKNTRDLNGGINEFKRGYQYRSNLVKDENGDLCQ